METRKLSDLKINPHNPRGAVTVDDSLRELAASIDAQGLLQPILITPEGVIVAGHRRTKACQLLNLQQIDVIVKNLSEIEQLAVMIVENIQRASLDVVQEGKAYLALKGHGLTNARICKTVGCAAETLKSRLAVASLAPEIHYAFASKQLGAVAAHRLLPLPRDKQVYWVERALKEHWSSNVLACAISGRKHGSANQIELSEDEEISERLSSLIDRLERVDKDMDRFRELSEMRSAQTFIRQAQAAIMNGMVARRKQNNIEEDQ